MANTFDQFDAPSKGASNAFDQFDEADAAGNEFKDRLKAGIGGIEAVGTMLGNVPAYIGGGLLGASNFIASGGDINRAREIQENFQNWNFGAGRAAPVSDYGKLAEQGMGEAQGAVADKAGDLGEKVGGNLGRATAEFSANAAMNFMPIPGAKGVHALAEGFKRELGGAPRIEPVTESVKPEPKVNAFDQFDEPSVMRVTPEGQAYVHDQATELARQRAEEMQRAAQEALDRSTQDVTYENIPPDAVIPRDALNGNLRVPRGNRWVADENGIPVRQGLPEEPLAKDVQNVDVNQPHVNDMGNAIQEANGPILGAGEIYGSQPLGQRGAIDINAVMDGLSQLKRGDIDPLGYTKLFAGTFSNDSWTKAMNDSFDPKSRSTLVLMSPDEFHKLAAQRTEEFQKGAGAEYKRDQIRQGLTSPEGLDSIPQLWVKDTPKGMKVWAHEGRHRMDVFRDMGIDNVPVIVRHDTKRLGGEAEMPSRILSEEGSSLPRNLPSPSPIRKGQRGAVDFQAIQEAAQKQMDRFAKFIEDIGGKHVDPHTPEEKVVLDALGERHYIPKGDAPEKIIADSRGQPDHPELWKNMQSGDINAGDKVNSNLLRGIGRWRSYGVKMGERFYNQKVRPLDRNYTALSTDDLIASQTALREGMFAGKDYTDAQLKEAGLSDKAVESYKMSRQAFKDALDVTNAGLRALGRKEIAPHEAYMASMWQGNWHLPIKDMNGKLAWYLKGESKADITKAIEYLKNNPELSKTLDLSKTEPKYFPQNPGKRAPYDVMGAYKDMLELMEPDMQAHVQQAMEAYMQGQGFRFEQHQKHFQNKNNVRGFQGDKPWLSAKENALQQAKAQINYLKEAYRWAPMQEAMANIKQVLSDKELNAQQPHNMALARAYVDQSLGISANLFKGAEHAIQEWMTSGPLKFMPNSISRFVGSLKNMTYLTQLGLSPGYMIATPLQAFLLGPARHFKLSGEGYKHNFLETGIKALYDFSVGVAGHEVNNVLNNKMRPPMTPIGREAFKYMEDNGIISQNIFHEASGLGEWAAVHGLKQVVGGTISFPEKVARAATFMSFVHHLDASGKFPTQAELFRRAEELTNHTLTDFRRMNRPLIVDKMGQLGELAYTYKSPVFNQYNNLAEFARDAMNGKPGPLLSALGMTALLGGMVSLPFVNEADSAWQLIKEGVAKGFFGIKATASPTLYPKISGLGIKGTIISKMNEVAANDKVKAALGESGARFLGDTLGYGAVSAGTGSQMASRFSSAIGEVKNPIDQLSPVTQELKEWAAMAGAASGRIGALQGTYGVMPPMVKGQMETQIPDFKTVKQKAGQGYANPNQLSQHETAYIRTPEEETKRKFGLTSLQEATTKSARYINQQENSNFHSAQEASVDKMFDAILRKDKPDVQKYARAFFYNNGDVDQFQKDLDSKLDKYMFTPEQRAIIKAQSIAAVKGVIRMRKMQGAYAN